MPAAKYRCTNFANCDRALNREEIELEEGADPICPPPGCGEKLELIQSRGRGVPKWVLGLGALVLVAIALIAFLSRRPSPHVLNDRPVVQPPKLVNPPPAPEKTAVESCNDHDLADALNKRFASDEDLKAYSIQVDVANKTVILSGSVGAASDRAHAEDVVHFTGCPVASLVDDLTTTPNDDAIAALIRKAYAADPELRKQPINVEVSRGNVVLSGSVATHVMKTNAGYRVSKIHGARNVTNNLDVNPMPPATVSASRLPSDNPANTSPITPDPSRASRPRLSGSWSGTYQSCAQGESPVQVQMRDAAPDDITALVEIDVPGSVPGTFVSHGVLNTLTGYLALQFSGWQHQPPGLAMGNVGGYVTFTQKGATGLSAIVKAPGCGQITLKKQ